MAAISRAHAIAGDHTVWLSAELKQPYIYACFVALPAPPGHAVGGASVDLELAEAGFRGIVIAPFNGHMRLGTSPEHAALQLTSLMGPASRALKNVDEKTRSLARDAIAKDMAAFQGSEPEIAPGTACWLVTAKA